MKALATLLAFALPIAALSSQAVLGNIGNGLEAYQKQYIAQNNLNYEFVSHSSFNDHRLRIVEPKLCDPSVKQYSGYLDISGTKHLFFWFFESRKSPSTAPLILWLNGGPGGSSLLGTLTELGPCWIADEGKNTTYNPHSWNTEANIIFLDQPVQVGFSYDDHNRNTVNTSAVGAQDVYAFFQLFYHRFPEYSTLPLHIAGESYGGVYVPNIANAVYQHNKDVTVGPKHINLVSVILANAMSDPKIQYASIFDYACGGGAPYRVFDPEVVGYNPYDIRKKCQREADRPLCYDEPVWIEKWMNIPANKITLGVPPERNFTAVNMAVYHDFLATGEMAFDTKALLPELVNDGIRLLVYAGDCDTLCTNYIGKERWLEALDTKFHDEFSKAKLLPWYDSATGRHAGEVRSAGTAGNLTYVRIYDAGHMAPYDQPEALLDLITRWLQEIPFA
ncbi:carboxypeptidase c [Moniliophthora roreri]|uniref:Carboxypeptidase n=1 Tax=Moniliophthora roreri TaxID=221103 RepID=A0A0W0GDZ9_MONRR|nr:carboxypeptidase c [Moniliophthora roreri]